MKKLKLPTGTREDFDLLLVHGAARWPLFEKRVAAAFAAAWQRLPRAEKDAVRAFWGKWEKRRKPQAWLKLVDTLAPEVKDPKTWSWYEPTGGIFTLVAPPLLAMPDDLFEVFVARELRRAVMVAQGAAAEDWERVCRANREAGYDEESLQQWERSVSPSAGQRPPEKQL